MRPQELNLLVIFDVIMTEKSITRTAQRLSMTQPAVSNAVARMRISWGDELFVKDGRNIKPTAHAKNLWQQIKEPLYSLHKAIAPDQFDPATVERTFCIAASDITVDNMWPQLWQLFERQAPGINLYTVPYIIENAQQMLDDAKVDLVISATTPYSPNIRSRFLFDSGYVCTMRVGHPLASGPIDLEAFSQANHVFVSLSGDNEFGTQWGMTDQVLQQQGLSRRIAMTVNNFASAANIVMQTDLVCVMPAGAIHQYVADGKLAVVACPVELPKTAITMLWHKRQDQDEGLEWLRGHIEAKFVTGWNENMAAVYAALKK